MFWAPFQQVTLFGSSQCARKEIGILEVSLLTQDLIRLVTGRKEADSHDDGDEGGLGHRGGSQIFSPMRQIVQEVEA